MSHGAVLTIEVSPAVLLALEAEAAAQGRAVESIAADLLEQFSAKDEEGDDPDTLKAIREGLDDIAAGRTILLEDYIAETEATAAAAALPRLRKEPVRTDG